MVELFGDLWDFYEASTNSCLVITTNGAMNKRGECVMGRGIALQAKERFPSLPAEVGVKLRQGGNRVYGFPKYRIITFPVKDVWHQAARPELIETSAHELWRLVEMQQIQRIYMPRPGCDNGRLNWADVKPLIDFLDNRFTIVEWNPERAPSKK